VQQRNGNKEKLDIIDIHKSEFCVQSLDPFHDTTLIKLAKLPLLFVVQISKKKISIKEEREA
jgi:hypothetical protein